MKTVADYYNKTATGWSDEWFNEKKQSLILEKFYNCYAEVGTSRPKILDLGCGAGYDAKVLSKMGARVVGIDFSEKLVSIAKDQVANCKFFVGNITDPFDKLGTFDGILCLATIMHIDVQKMHKTFENMGNTLSRNG